MTALKLSAYACVMMLTLCQVSLTWSLFSASWVRLAVGIVFLLLALLFAAITNREQRRIKNASSKSVNVWSELLRRIRLERKARMN